MAYFSLDSKHRIVNVYITDEYNREHTEAISYEEARRLCEQVLKATEALAKEAAKGE